jgi:hypothetical protein
MVPAVGPDAGSVNTCVVPAAPVSRRLQTASMVYIALAGAVGAPGESRFPLPRLHRAQQRGAHHQALLESNHCPRHRFGPLCR